MYFFARRYILLLLLLLSLLLLYITYYIIIHLYNVILTKIKYMRTYVCISIKQTQTHC